MFAPFHTKEREVTPDLQILQVVEKSLVSFPRPTDLPTTSTLQMRRRRRRLQRFWSQGQ
jgi:hypothetical protein